MFASGIPFRKVRPSLLTSYPSLLSRSLLLTSDIRSLLELSQFRRTLIVVLSQTPGWKPSGESLHGKAGAHAIGGIRHASDDDLEKKQDVSTVA